MAAGKVHRCIHFSGPAADSVPDSKLNYNFGWNVSLDFFSKFWLKLERIPKLWLESCHWSKFRLNRHCRLKFQLEGWTFRIQPQFLFEGLVKWKLRLELRKMSVDLLMWYARCSKATLLHLLICSNATPAKLVSRAVASAIYTVHWAACCVGWTIS